MTHMWLEILEQPKVFEKCLIQNEKNIRTIVSILKERNIRHVIIAARGTSDHAGIYAKYLAEIKLGIPVTLAAPSIFTLYNGNLKMDDSLVIGISQSGRAADVLEVINKAKAQGALTVSITNHADSPLAQEAEFHLDCAAGVEKSVSATKTFTTQVYLLAHLIAEWAEDEALKNELSKVPEIVQKVIDNADYIKSLVQRYRFMNECFVLGRGINFPIALESALKIQETSYVRAKAYATSDFHHGPFAMIDNHMPVIIFAPEGPTLADSMEMINKLKNAGADVLVVSNNAEALSKGDTSIEIPNGAGEFAVPFANAVVGQIFACSLSVLRGLNPDTPRGLSKVTITR